MESRISTGRLTRVGVGPVVLRVREIMLEVDDFTDAEEEELRRLRMMLDSVFIRMGTIGGRRERTD